MSFIQIQILIFLSILICSLIGGKKSSLIASLVWLIETFIVYKENSLNKSNKINYSNKLLVI